MAPILALLSYYGVNALVSEKPHAAEAGQSYQLAEKPNCRYQSGNCGLKNGDFELQFSFERRAQDQLALKLRSVNPLDGVMLAVVENEDDDSQPVAMRAMGDDGLIWTLDVAVRDPLRQRLRLVAAFNESLYYGDVAMKFTIEKSAD
jgi:hypothetical protein